MIVRLTLIVWHARVAQHDLAPLPVLPGVEPEGAQRGAPLRDLSRIEESIGKVLGAVDRRGEDLEEQRLLAATVYASGRPRGEMAGTRQTVAANTHGLHLRVVDRLVRRLVGGPVQQLERLGAAAPRPWQNNSRQSVRSFNVDAAFAGALGAAMIS